MAKADDIERIKADLKTAFDADQAARKQPNSSTIRVIDAQNTAMLKRIIAEHGWPTVSTFGKAASQHAWTLAQHADRDPQLQKDALALIYPLLQTREVAPNNYAYLYDRVAVNSKNPQYFGTQGQDDGKGGWQPYPINGLGNTEQITRNAKDLAILNARRKNMFIEPERFEDYFAQMNNITAQLETGLRR